ncbi:hypothetical protein ACFE04_010571 [Oxalis oulophora]
MISRVIKSCRNNTQIFSKLENPSTRDCNDMIRAYSMSDSPQKGLNVYNKMRQIGNFTDPVSLSFALKCCITLSYLTVGQQIHSRIWSDGFLSDTLLLTTLMDFYSSRGKIDEACRVFDDLPNKDVVSWNVFISCHIRNARTKDCLALFHRMRAEDQKEICKPDDVTCLHMLQACSSLGALEFGQSVHKYIQENGYIHAAKLCNSLISMYSRCGNVDKAYQVFEGMKKRTGVSWSAIISGLAMNGHGREAIEAFEAMLRDGIKPDDHIFTGVLSACSHCGMDDVYKMLDEINEQLKIAGYLPDISAELHNLQADDKRCALVNHSEKLAMAFGVLTTPPGTTIRVANSCRLCVDCHNFAKFLSEVYNREVDIRDGKKFHHFREGHCSCNDYW